MYSNNHYNKSLKTFARAHRNESTHAEVRLWVEALSKRQMLGYQFLRQRPIDNFIVDFFCKELKLVIEVDGYTHQFDETYKKDLKKEQRLLELGYFIIRFRDEEVIVWKIEEIKKHHPPLRGRRPNPPSPKHNPLHKGDNYLPNKKVAPPN